ncbi:MAG: patatin family protein [Gemmiger sp.]|nr:patatin family protein [Gemmiger sp.]
MPQLPQNSAILLEGGALRGCYTCGVLDVLMENDCYFPTVAAVSAGGLNAVNYLARQPGRGGRIVLQYRHDPRYVGPIALLKSRGVFGFDFMFNQLMEKEYFDQKTYDESPQRLFVCATNIDTGASEMFEKATCADFTKALTASASMPVCSMPVKVGGKRYLDGGCACAIPLDWARAEGYDKIVVVATRERGYRKPMPSQRMIDLYGDFYAHHTEFYADLLTMNWRYNAMMEELEGLEDAGKVFVLRPQKPVEVDRFEGNTQKLLGLINAGREDTQNALPALWAYLGIAETAPITETAKAAKAAETAQAGEAAEAAK